MIVSSHCLSYEYVNFEKWHDEETQTSGTGLIFHLNIGCMGERSEAVAGGYDFLYGKKASLAL